MNTTANSTKTTAINDNAQKIFLFLANLSHLEQKKISKIFSKIFFKKKNLKFFLKKCKIATHIHILENTFGKNLNLFSDKLDIFNHSLNFVKLQQQSESQFDSVLLCSQYTVYEIKWDQAKNLTHE